MTRKPVCVVVFVLLVSWGAAQGETPRLELSVDRTRVEVGDQITLTVTLTAEGDVPAPELPVPDGFDVIGRSTYTTQELNITNGRVVTTRNNSFVYSLRATRDGSFRIGPAHVMYEGRRHESATARVNVAKRGVRPQTRPAPGQSPRGPDAGELRRTCS